MKHNLPMALLLVVVLATAAGFKSHAGQGAAPQPQSDNNFVYADFEKIENGRLVSNRGGMVQIHTSQQSTPLQFKGLANASPGAPDIVRVKPDDPNHLAAFDYTLTAPNQWANVTLEIQGHPFQDNKPVADDVTAYKNLSVQLYATGVDYLRVEFVTHGQGLNINNGFPQTSVRIRPGLNTYLIPLKSITQPTWAQDRVDAKEVLKKLTAVSISTYCNQCLPQKGTVLVDNLIFQK